MEVVAAGLDSLNIGFNIAKWLIDEKVFKRLDEAKCAAAEKLFGGKAVTVELLGHEFNMTPRGSKGWEYVMHNNDVRLNLARECHGGRVFPEAFTQLNSNFLWGEGQSAAYEKSRLFVAELGTVVGEKVNRADICVDLAVDLPHLDVKREVVTRARSKKDYVEVEHYTEGIRDTGYRFGSGVIVARLYDKSHEIKASHKEWFRPIWLKEGWNGTSNVTRAEFQTRREVLQEFGVDSYSDLTERIPDLFRYLAGKWLVLKQRNEMDSNHRRWETSDLWKSVQNAGVRFGECQGVQRWKQKQPSIDSLTAQMKGIIVSIVAIDTGIRGEYFAIDRLGSEVSAYLKSAEFLMKVLERRGRFANLGN
ncbi:MAG: hypothetical protein HYX80_06055 [Chloroflexi bacterium]|nr:hypothetical protein [Chloroflexota bacterium]